MALSKGELEREKMTTLPNSPAGAACVKSKAVVDLLSVARKYRHWTQAALPLFGMVAFLVPSILLASHGVSILYVILAALPGFGLYCYGLATCDYCAACDEEKAERVRAERIVSDAFMAEAAAAPVANIYDLVPYAGKKFMSRSYDQHIISIEDDFIHLDPETFRLCHNLGVIDLAQIKALHELQARRA